MSVIESIIPWQLRKGRNTDKKVETVRQALLEARATSVIDIGCNAGVVTRAMGEAGLFAVGIEQEHINIAGVEEPLKGACLGNIHFDDQLVARMPPFDAALLLSVHHHFVREIGDTESKTLIRRLGEKISKVIIFEVSSKSTEYGREKNELFTDGSEASVLNYTEKWLSDALPQWRFKHIWTNVRRPKLSNRYMVSCTKT